MCIVRSMLIYLNLDELYFYSFIISMNRCNGPCNTVEDPFYRTCAPNKIEDVNLKVFIMIKRINVSKTFSNYISCACRCKFYGRKCNLIQKWNNDDSHCEYKKHGTCKKKIISWNLTTCPCECNNGSDIAKYLKECECMKILVDDPIVT